jgi:hypothetical protein
MLKPEIQKPSVCVGYQRTGLTVMVPTKRQTRHLMWKSSMRTRRFMSVAANVPAIALTAMALTNRKRNNDEHFR